MVYQAGIVGAVYSNYEALRPATTSLLPSPPVDVNQKRHEPLFFLYHRRRKHVSGDLLAPTELILLLSALGSRPQCIFLRSLAHFLSIIIDLLACFHVGGVDPKICRRVHPNQTKRKDTDMVTKYPFLMAQSFYT